MKTTLPFPIVILFMFSIVTILSQCKSGTETKAPEITEEVDTSYIQQEEVQVAEDTVTEDTKVIAKPVVARKPLTIIVQNLESPTAPVYISVYGTKSKFPEPKGQLKEYKFIPHGKELTAEIPNLKFGTYAIASYQDENSSGEIDKNFIGLPTEGYCFSNNFKPKVKAPDFDDCSFAYTSKNNLITIRMIR